MPDTALVSRRVRQLSLMMPELRLSIHEYCAEDDSYTVHGTLPAAPDLGALAERATTVSDKVMHMQRLDTLVVVIGDTTVHLHGNGEIVVNHTASMAAARKILESLLCEKK